MPKVMKASIAKKSAVKKSAANVNSRRLKKPATKKSAAAIGKSRKRKSLITGKESMVISHGDIVNVHLLTW